MAKLTQTQVSTSLKVVDTENDLEILGNSLKLYFGTNKSQYTILNFPEIEGNQKILTEEYLNIENGDGDYSLIEKEGDTSTGEEDDRKNYSFGRSNAAFGHKNKTYQRDSFAFGGGNTVGDSTANADAYTFSTAFGATNIVKGRSNFVSGESNSINGSGNFIGGMYQSAEGSSGTLIAGAHNTADGFNYAAIFGSGNTAQADYQMILGKNADVDSDTLFAIGNTGEGQSRTNAFSVDKNGNIEAKLKLIANAIDTPHFNVDNTGNVYALSSARIGNNNYISSGNMFSFIAGQSNSITGGQSVCLGSNNTIRSTSSFAAGYGNIVSANYSVGIGYNNTVSGICGNAIGYSNEIEAAGAYSSAVGFNLIVHSPYQTVVGKYNDPPGSGTIFAVGCGTDDDHRSNAFRVLTTGNVQSLITPSADEDVIRKTDLTASISRSTGFAASFKLLKSYNPPTNNYDVIRLQDVVSTSKNGLVPKGNVVSSQNQFTKFLREDGIWATPSYTADTNTAHTHGAGTGISLSGNAGTSGETQTISVSWGSSPIGGTYRPVYWDGSTFQECNITFYV